MDSRFLASCILCVSTHMDLFKSFVSIIFVGYDNEFQQAPSCHQIPEHVSAPQPHFGHCTLSPGANEDEIDADPQIEVFLDLKTNLVAAVYKNIYELVFLQALRFHVFARSLPFGQRVAKIPFNFLRMVWNMAYYTSHLIGQSNKDLLLLHHDGRMQGPQNSRRCSDPPVDFLLCPAFTREQYLKHISTWGKISSPNLKGNSTLYPLRTMVSDLEVVIFKSTTSHSAADRSSEN
ncbi:uncharacterized protein ACBT44_008337 isoform 1-T1 [Syngnathus typhle]